MKPFMLSCLIFFFVSGPVLCGEYYEPKRQLVLKSVDDIHVFINYTTDWNVIDDGGGCLEARVYDLLVIGNGSSIPESGYVEIRRNRIDFHCSGHVCMASGKDPLFTLSLKCAEPEISDGKKRMTIHRMKVVLSLRALHNEPEESVLIDPITRADNFGLMFKY